MPPHQQRLQGQHGCPLGEPTTGTRPGSRGLRSRAAHPPEPRWWLPRRETSGGLERCLAGPGHGGEQGCRLWRPAVRLWGVGLPHEAGEAPSPGRTRPVGGCWDPTSPCSAAHPGPTCRAPPRHSASPRRAPRAPAPQSQLQRSTPRASAPVRSACSHGH